MIKWTAWPLMILVLLIAAGCSGDNENKPDNLEENMLPNAREEQGFSLGFYDQEMQIEKERTFEIETDDFLRNILFRNKTNMDRSFTLIIFSNGEQKEFIVNGQREKVYHFNLESQQEANMLVKLVNIEDGFHAVDYIIMENSDIVIDSNDLTVADELSRIFNVRVNLFKDMNSIPTERPSLTQIGEDLTESRVEGLLINKHDKLYSALLQTESKETVVFDLVYGNLGEDHLDFYLVSLIDWKQERMNGSLKIYDDLASQENKKMKVSVENPKEGNNLRVIMLTNPFTPLTEESPFTSSPKASFKLELTK
ncbi:hypothetical protein ACH6EH_19530 [Paenibacillus sp. JSM ZJ436]|uniref:hypothetical protein n=1 Tax=Paenibacillus sp. JSM ZJ436 TaxID=3376190 RepID=UPI0037A5C2A9